MGSNPPDRPPGRLPGDPIAKPVQERGAYGNISGQVGAVGPNAHIIHENIVQQVQAGGIDLPQLAEELGRLRAHLRQEATSEPEAEEAIGVVAKAEMAAEQGDEMGVLWHLKAAGKWTLEIAEKIGVPVAVEVLKRVLP